MWMAVLALAMCPFRLEPRLLQRSASSLSFRKELKPVCVKLRWFSYFTIVS